MGPALVLDSESAFQHDLGIILANRGYQPVIVSTAREARGALSLGPFSLFLLNPALLLPDEIQDWLRRARTKRADGVGPAIILLGEPDSHIGAPEDLPFVDRTVDMRELRQSLETILDRATGQILPVAWPPASSAGADVKGGASSGRTDAASAPCGDAPVTVTPVIPVTAPPVTAPPVTPTPTTR